VVASVPNPDASVLFERARDPSPASAAPGESKRSKARELFRRWAVGGPLFGVVLVSSLMAQRALLIPPNAGAPLGGDRPPVPVMRVVAPPAKPASKCPARPAASAGAKSGESRADRLASALGRL
jgi:hypothetical protein